MIAVNNHKSSLKRCQSSYSSSQHHRNKLIPIFSIRFALLVALTMTLILSVPTTTAYMSRSLHRWSSTGTGTGTGTGNAGCALKKSMTRSMCVVGPSDLYDIKVSSEHKDTAKVALKSCQNYNTYRQYHPLPRHTRDVFERTVSFVNDFYASRKDSEQLVVLDSGVGRGMSTLQLSKRYPNVPVIGIDKSIHRLVRNKSLLRSLRDNDVTIDDDDNDEGEGEGEGEAEDSNVDEFDDDLNMDPRNVTKSTQYFNQLSDNCLLIRGDLIDFWLLAAHEAPWTIKAHYILYPNPYPKSVHLRRRWHGHPVFPAIMALGGRLVVKANWDTYCRELKTAITSIVDAQSMPGLTANVPDSKEVQILEPMTHFERKYKLAGIKVFEFEADLGQRNLSERRSMLSRL